MDLNKPVGVDEKIVGLLLARDEQGMRLLFEHFSPALYGIVLRIVRNEELARELLNDVFMKVWENIQSYDSSKSKFFTWMVRIARNAAIDMARSKRFKNENKTDQLDFSVFSKNEPSEQMNVQNLELKKLLDYLDEDHRKIIDLMYFQDYSQSEIEKEFNIPLGTVKTRARRAILQLREFLKSDILKIMLLLLAIFLWLNL
ncbi:MAG TPA: sigma-70 family RNA polymerase sigma factor [Saprospiraceae bacterium]|nr:sigma-70 family RNA polymerase sigma factor [Saprospiraceae bacterium]